MPTETAAHADPDFLTIALIFLAAAVIAVPIANRAKLGSIVGYLGAGILIGPQVLGLVRDPATVLSIAELGIVMFLFLIGLEMKPSRIWTMRKDIFGLGGLQVLVTGLVIMWVPLAFGRELNAAIIAGFGLAITSTAILMQILDEGAEVQSPHGQRAFAVSIFQDLMIVPLLALVAFLAPISAPSATAWWIGAAKIIGAIAAVVLAGRFLLNPLFKLLASSASREIMTAAALLVVIGAAAIMTLAGLSMAMGAFLAGVFLSESRFRHQLEADIEPFRGLLMGLFFISIGMTVDIHVVAGAWWQILIAVVLLIINKSVVMYGLMRLFRYDHEQAVRAALLIAQAGEFGFVLYAAAVAAGVMRADHASLLVALVVISMALSPFLYRLAGVLTRKRGTAEAEREEDFSGTIKGSVLVIGFGRFGQIVCQMLLSQRVDVTIIDNDVEMIDSGGKFGFKVFYGDGSRYDVLRAAGADSARLICICTDDRDTTSRIVDICKVAFPLARLYARSYDRRHTIELIGKGVDFEMRETYESGISFGRSALEALDLPAEAAAEVAEDIRRRDQERLTAQIAGDMYSGSETLYVGPGVNPEPLTPARKRKAPFTGILPGRDVTPSPADPTIADGGAGL